MKYQKGDLVCWVKDAAVARPRGYNTAENVMIVVEVIPEFPTCKYRYMYLASGRKDTYLSNRYEEITFKLAE